MGHQHDKKTFLLLVAVGCACFFYWMYFCFGDAVSVPYAVGGNARPNVGKRLRHLAPAPLGPVWTWVNNRSSVERTLDRGEGDHNIDVPSFTDAPAVTAAPSGKVPQEYASVVNKTWIKWTEANSPASYRACVSKPRDNSMLEVVTGGLVERSPSMDITRCVRKCITLNFTYAALTRGTECFCSAVQGESPLLTYTENTHCDTPCSGQPRYNCGGKEFMSLYRTSVPDPRCSEAVLRPRGSLPLIALASYPRSGNTWTRQLIERATGILTGSVYWQVDRSMRFYKTIFPGGNIDYRGRQTICVKSHYQILGHIRQFKGAVLLIRNPYHTLVAEEFRREMLQGGHKSAEEMMDFFNSTEWRNFAESAAVRWKNTTVNWIRNVRRIHVVHYENLRENTYEELVKIVQFLGVPVQRERLLCATQEHPSSKLTGIALGNYGEKTRLYLTEDPFPPDIRKLVDKNIEIVNATLLKHNLTPLPRDYSVEVF